MRDEWIVLGTSAELEAQLVEFERLHPGGTFSFPGGAVCRNVVFYSFLDTAITSLLITAGLLDWRLGAQFVVVAESGCRYHRSVAFPDPIDVGLRVARLGTSSVRYELGVFGADGPAAAEGFFVHICVDSVTRRPVPLPDQWRSVLARFG